MEGFTLIDAIVAGVIVLSAILAYSRGLVREMMAIVGWIGAAILAFVFASVAEPLVKEIPMVGDFLQASCELARIASFAAIFALGLILMSLFTPLLSSMIQRSVLGGVDQGLGFMFGVLRGIVLIAVAFLVYNKAMGGSNIDMVDNSRSAKVFASFQAALEAQLPEDVPTWAINQYEALVGHCGTPTTPVPAQTPPATTNG